MPTNRNQVASERPHVALLVETSLGSGRDILKGISRYIREHGQWALFHEPRSLEDSVPEWISRWKGDGIIARIQNQEMADLLSSTDIPVVDVLGMVPDCGIPLVHVDDSEIAELGAEHLLERGFRNFAFYGMEDENWSERREKSFCERIESRGFKAVSKLTPRRSRRFKTWEQQEDELASWIAGLPTPVGVMVCSDQRATDLLEACHRANVEVPDEVAVIGVDNDEALCEVAYPPLSSVWPAHNQVGYEAAALLARLMNGEEKPTDTILTAPGGVRVRQSSDVLAIDDRNLAKALQVIRDSACEGINVDEVSRQCGLSRSVLQRRFRKQLGRTVHDEILKVRLNRACDLIAETELPLIDIAERAGFKHQEYMGVVFKNQLGLTPAQYRREARFAR